MRNILTIILFVLCIEVCIPLVSATQWTEYRITTSPAPQYSPDISDNIVVWCDYRYSTPSILAAEISDPNTPVEFTVSKSSYWERYSTIGGNHIFFLKEDLFNCASGTQSENNIFSYDLDDGSIKQITYNSCSTAGYVLGGSDDKMVVWRAGNRIKGYDVTMLC